MHRPAVADLLRVPDAAYTTFTVNDDVIDVWHAALGDFDASIVRAVVGHWVTERDQAPTVANIVEGCRTEVRTRGEKNRMRAIAAGPADPARAKGTIALLREILAAAQEGDPLTGPEVVEVARARGLVAPPSARRCVCSGGFVERRDGSAVEPCERCNEEARERWLAGAYRGVRGGA